MEMYKTNPGSIPRLKYDPMFLNPVTRDGILA
jgi:hypothetical protein